MENHIENYPWLKEHWSFFIQRLEQDRFAHALLMEGPAGSGKMVLANAMVARLLCRENKTVACGQCRSCVLLAGGAHPDHFDVQPEDDSEFIKVDQVRGLISRLDLTTSISTRKVACVHPAECMNAAAANALLKSLEEPAGETVLILVSDNPGRLPVTIRSRCQAISVYQPETQVASDWLQKTTGKGVSEVNAALQAAGGRPLRAVQYLDSPELDAFGRVQEGLAQLLVRPGSVSIVATQLADLNPAELWRWLSICTGEAVKSRMTGKPLAWLPSLASLQDKPLLLLQRQADINRQLSSTPVRGDLLLQDWLIRWAEQII